MVRLRVPLIPAVCFLRDWPGKASGGASLDDLFLYDFDVGQGDFPHTGVVVILVVAMSRTDRAFR